MLNPSILGEDPREKRVEFDVHARDTAGRRFIVEMQRRRVAHWAERNVYYLARGLSRQLLSGQGYGQLKPSIGVTLLEQSWLPDVSDQSDWRFTLRDAARPVIEFSDVLQWHVVELSKALPLIDSRSAALQAWVTCLRHNLDEDIMSQIAYPPVREALDHLEAMCSDEELQIRADLREKALWAERDALHFAKIEGIEEGLQQGLERGLEQGLEQGLERGRRQALQDILEQQMLRRLGTVPAHARGRLQQADAAQLADWSLNLLDATTLDQVFR